MIFLSWALGLTFLGAALVLFARKPEEDDLALVGTRRRENRR